MRKPFWNKARQQWYVWHSGKQTPLGPDKESAHHEWHKLKSVTVQRGPEMQVCVLIECFLAWSDRTLAPETHVYYKRYLQLFANEYWELVAAECRPHHVHSWLVKLDIQTAAQRRAIRSVQRAYSFGLTEGYLVANPLAGLKKPPQGRRESLVSVADHSAILDQTDAAFRLVVIVLRHSGCRPGELRVVTAAQFDERRGAWVFHQHKTSAKTGKPRIVYLSPCLVTLTRILTAGRPTGPLFLNRYGKPWTKNALRCRMRRLREKLGLPAGTVTYSYRHTFTTDALEKGMTSSVLAELLGHRDTSMIDRHYGHLDQRSEFLRAAAKRAAGLDARTAEPTGDG